jgi:hypothetical protein
MPIQGRIANPFMPQGLPTLTNSPTLYAPGELGGQFFDQNLGCVYKRVQLDSGATSATATGAVKAGQLAFFKNEAAALVTNDPNFNDTGTPANSVNRVAGIFQTAVTPGNYCDLLVNGKSQAVAGLASATVVPGAQVIADTVANIQAGGGAKTLASVTTAPTQQVLGVAVTSTNTGAAPNATFLVDVTIGFVD